MIDIFLHKDIHALLKDKSIVFMGDSNTRALYKDFLCLFNGSKLIPDMILKRKMENSVFGDKLVSYGPKSNGRNYREERSARIGKTQLSFFFLTRVYDEYMKDILNKITCNTKPDVLVINCCLWDVTRWGASGVETYKANLRTLMQRMKELLPDSLVIWVTTPPISCDLKGGFLVKELEFFKYSLRFHVVEANHYARKVVLEHGFDVLDSHYHLKLQIHRRAGDGIHWLPPAVRYVTNLLLTHISLAWNVPLPHRYESPFMEENIRNITEVESTVIPVIAKKDISGQGKTNPSIETSAAKVTEKKKDKENCDTPKRNPKRRRKRTPSLRFKGSSRRNESHHAYENKLQHNKRLQRIRQWQPPVPAYSPHSYSASPSPANSRYNSPQSDNLQHDSGYFPSPVYASLSNGRSFIEVPSPSQIPLPVDPYPFDSPRTFHSPIQPPLPSSPYIWERPPLPKEPYPFSPQGQPQHWRQSPLRYSPQEQYIRFSNRNHNIQKPYAFPHVVQGQTLQPRD